MTELQYEERTIRVNRVSKVVKGGRRFSFAALDGGRRRQRQGRPRLRQGQGGRRSPSRRASRRPRKNMFNVPLAGSTITHPIIGESGAGRVC